jgi:hypothetical protein
MISPLEKDSQVMLSFLNPEKAAAFPRDGRAEMPSQNHPMNDGY